MTPVGLAINVAAVWTRGLARFDRQQRRTHTVPDAHERNRAGGDAANAPGAATTFITLPESTNPEVPTLAEACISPARLEITRNAGRAAAVGGARYHDRSGLRMTWVHWVLYNLPADSSGLPEGATTSDLATGTEEGINDWKRTGYGGPCPPVGQHRYFHKLYALDTVLEGLNMPAKAQLEFAMQGHILAQAELLGTYQKGQ